MRRLVIVVVAAALSLLSAGTLVFVGVSRRHNDAVVSTASVTASPSRSPVPGPTLSANETPPPALVYGTPPPRYAAALAADSSGHLLLFAGRGSDGDSVLTDTWAWDGSGWVRQRPDASPPGRGFAGAAYDPVRHETLLFGGGTVNADPERNDTWVWDGRGWTQRHPAVSPPASGSRLLAYVPAIGKLVLLSGGTWTWDGTNWMRQSTASGTGAGPQGGVQQAVGIDRLGRLVVFGGAYNGPNGDPSGPNGNRRDTWVYDQVGWHQLHPATTPSGGVAAMAYDAARAQLVMVEADGTWTWDGTDWTHRRPAHQPPALDLTGPNAFAVAIAFDVASQRVMFLGSGQTWTWDGMDWTRSH
jgi:hypothetical protein